jgi:hypothetical protein
MYVFRMILTINNINRLLWRRSMFPVRYELNTSVLSSEPGQSVRTEDNDL